MLFFYIHNQNLLIRKPQHKLQTEPSKNLVSILLVFRFYPIHKLVFHTIKRFQVLSKIVQLLFQNLSFFHKLKSGSIYHIERKEKGFSKRHQKIKKPKLRHFFENFNRRKQVKSPAGAFPSVKS